MKFEHPHARDGVLVQITHPLTGELVARVPAVFCTACGDVVLGGVNLDRWGRCACCASRAPREAHGAPARSFPNPS